MVFLVVTFLIPWVFKDLFGCFWFDPKREKNKKEGIPTSLLFLAAGSHSEAEKSHDYSTSKRKEIADSYSQMLPSTE
jgi:hypothetical protein